MEDSVAFLAVEAVFNAIILQIFEDTRVTLAALIDSQRLRLRCIEFWSRRNRYRRGFFPFTGACQHRKGK
jgi:hypothetical protein